MTDASRSPALTSVHSALQAASLADKTKLDVPPTSFRLDLEVKAEAQLICERHGTSLSEFLRQCCAGLVRDYRE